jgi:hypothetical protein
LHERAVGLVDEPLRLGRDRAEHERALARPGHPGEHRQPALGDLDAHVLEVVFPGTMDTDQVVTVSDMHGATLTDPYDIFSGTDEPAAGSRSTEV